MNTHHFHRKILSIPEHTFSTCSCFIVRLPSYLRKWKTLPFIKYIINAYLTDDITIATIRCNGSDLCSSGNVLRSHAPTNFQEDS